MTKTVKDCSIQELKDYYLKEKELAPNTIAIYWYDVRFNEGTDDELDLQLDEEIELSKETIVDYKDANIFDGDMPPKKPQSICVVGITFISPKDKCEYTVDYISYNEEKCEFTYLISNISDWSLPSKIINGAQLNELMDTEDGSNIKAFDIGNVVQLVSDESRHNDIYHTIKEIIPDFNRCIYLYRFFDIDELYKDDDFNFVREEE